ncbi:MAG TPA: hypothetical protein VF411_15235 [Bacteroidia bacterium]
MINDVKEHNKKFLKNFGKLLFIVLVLSFILGQIDQSTDYFKFKSNEYYKDILIALISFLGVLIGFIIVGLSVFVAALHYRHFAEGKEEEKKKLNDYWNYLIQIIKLPIFILVLTIFSFIIILTFKHNIEQSCIYICVLPFCVCLAGQVTYMSIDRLYDFFSNPSL